MIVAGGLGSTTGAVVAAVVLTLLPEAMRAVFITHRRGQRVAGAEHRPAAQAHLRVAAGGDDADPAAGPVRHARDLGPLQEEEGRAHVSDALLHAKKVSIRFGGLKALSEFELEIRKGDLKGLIGPNGAGKTTAFNVLTGVYLPSEGEIFVCGAEGERPPPAPDQPPGPGAHLPEHPPVQGAHRARQRAHRGAGRAHAAVRSPQGRGAAPWSLPGPGGGRRARRARQLPRLVARPAAHPGLPAGRGGHREARARIARGDGPLAPGGRVGEEPALRRAAPAGDRPRAGHAAPGCCCSTSPPRG